MSAEAIIFMVIAMIVLWGGLAIAIIRLIQHDLPEDLPGPDEIRRDL